jgi:hypothetical protein
MSYTHKIQKDKGAEPDEFEASVAQVRLGTAAAGVRRRKWDCGGAFTRTRGERGRRAGTRAWGMAQEVHR